MKQHVGILFSNTRAAAELFQLFKLKSDGPVLAVSVDMKTVIIVSKCLGVIKNGHPEAWYGFHFKGVYSGELVKKVILVTVEGQRFIRGEEFLLYVQLLSLKDGVMKGKILKFRRLDDCWDRS